MMENHPAPPSIGVEPPAELSARIRQEVARDIAPARGPSALQRWALGLSAVAAMLVAVYAVSFAQGHPPAADRALPVLIAGIAMVAAATFISLGRAGSETVSIGVRAVIALAPPFAFLVLAWLTTSVVPTSHDDADGGGHLGCFGNGALMAAAPMVALLALWRRTDPFTPRLTGALIGGWAGLTGAVGLSLACPSGDLAHLALGHGGAVIGGAILGAWLGRGLLSP